MAGHRQKAAADIAHRDKMRVLVLEETEAVRATREYVSGIKEG